MPTQIDYLLPSLRDPDKLTVVFLPTGLDGEGLCTPVTTPLIQSSPSCAAAQYLALSDPGAAWTGTLVRKKMKRRGKA